ncbi:MAG TPA: class I SAM-dependent methyltransferase [Ktedonobacterales bacterium]|nr:class I SAM-dependent methyltransferase [Ktedonobacterales bacterium]
MSTSDPRFHQATEITTATYDQKAEDYAERNAERGPFWVERMERFIGLMEEALEERPIADLSTLGRPGDDITLEEYLAFVPVLDAGCGPGRDARAMAALGLPVLAVDISQGMLDAAGERTPRRLPKGAIRYALMDLRRLDLPDACARGVWCSASLLHLPHRTAPRAMAELARVARAGAPVAVFLKLRKPDEEPERYEPYPGENPDNLTRFFAYYSEDEAAALLTGAGLELVELLVRGKPVSPNDHAWICALGRRP